MNDVSKNLAPPRVGPCHSLLYSPPLPPQKCTFGHIFFLTGHEWSLTCWAEIYREHCMHINQILFRVIFRVKVSCIISVDGIKLFFNTIDWSDTTTFTLKMTTMQIVKTSVNVNNSPIHLLMKGLLVSSLSQLCNVSLIETNRINTLFHLTKMVI